MWIWDQAEGALMSTKRAVHVYGYAGRGIGKNNPAQQAVKGIGPIPRGVYTIQAPHDSDVTGPYTLTLIPDESNEMFGRSSFAIHGDSLTQPGQASHGCIVIGRADREAIWNSGDRRVHVI